MCRAMILTALLFTFGCASSQGRHETPVASSATAPLSDVEPRQEEAMATALAFDPPIARDQPALMLDREPRRATAFVGYDDTVTTFSYTRTDDRVISDNDGRYERRAFSEKFSVTTR